MLWLYGPAGIGKSAVAQSIAEHCSETGRLGAAFFFSKLKTRNDPTRIIPTIAYQLAVHFPDYKRLITKCLADDPTILEKALRQQFKKLIVEPFTSLKAKKSSCVQQPLLIVLDGLDECPETEAQCEIVEIIGELVRLAQTFPLLWMICSRPEWHLKHIFSRADFRIKCRREELLVDEDESKKDVHLFLKEGFEEIRQRFWDALPEDWPPEYQLLEIVVQSSGLFVFASTILKFVGDRDCGNPKSQLDICLNFISNIHGTRSTNPLHSLDLLYRRILADVPRDALHITMRILAFYVFFPDAAGLGSIQRLANFLSITQDRFYGAMRKLHSVLDIPQPNTAYYRTIEFYHASFRDFLEDEYRSGPFFLNKSSFCREVAEIYIRWFNYFHECQVKGKPTLVK